MVSLAEMERELIVERARRSRCGPSASPQGRPQAADDRQQDRIGQEIAGEWRAAQGRGEEPRRIPPYAVPQGSSIRAHLAYDFFRFLWRPQLKQPIDVSEIS